jgi:hypothetical protein
MAESGVDHSACSKCGFDAIRHLTWGGIRALTFFRTRFVVLVGLSYGMPAAYLDLGGRRDIVIPNFGVIVKTSGLDTARVASRIVRQICDLFSSPVILAEMSVGAISRANEFNLSSRVAPFYQGAVILIERARLRGDPAPARSRANVAAEPVSRK